MAETDSRLVVAQEVSIPLSEFEFAYVRSSGPGGQNVNKVNSQAQLSWDLTKSTSLPEDVLQRLKIAQAGRITKAGILRIDCQRFRDREKNRQECLDRVRKIVEAVLKPPKKRRKTIVPRRTKEQRLREKHQRGEVKRSRRQPKHDD